MQDEIDEFFRCVRTGEGWAFQVGVLTWHGPHTPILVWRTFRRWKTMPDKERFDRARRAAKANTRFFRKCARCKRLLNAGHMHDKDTCDSCAEHYLGVVH